MTELEYKLIKGNGPTLIFINGFRMPYSNWDKVCDLLEPQHSILLYNRKGVGQSAKANTEQTGEQVISQLYSLLSNLALPPPYVLIAHSIGGVYAELFARRYSKEVAAVIFVDATHPEELKHNALLTQNFIGKFLRRSSKLFDKYKYSEIESIDNTMAYRQSLAAFPNIPVSVITGAKNIPFAAKAGFELHKKYQHEYLKLSTLSKLHVLEHSHHFPQISEPQKVGDIILSSLSFNYSSQTAAVANKY